MDTESRVLITVGSSLQIVGISLTAVYLHRSRRRFARRAESLQRQRVEAAERGGLASLIAALIALFVSARTEAGRAWRAFAGYALVCAWWLLRKAGKKRKHLVVQPQTAGVHLSATAAAVVTRAKAPRFREGVEVSAQLDELAEFADALVVRLDEERRILEELVAGERSTRGTEIGEINRDVDELAAGGIRIGAWGVLFLVVGTGLSLAAAWT